MLVILITAVVFRPLCPVCTSGPPYDTAGALNGLWFYNCQV